jgi:hypothetical protein
MAIKKGKYPNMQNTKNGVERQQQSWSVIGKIVRDNSFSARLESMGQSQRKLRRKQAKITSGKLRALA